MAAVTVETMKQREALKRDGYFVAPQVLDRAVLDALRAYSGQVLAAIPGKLITPTGGLGAPDYRHPAVTQALTNASLLGVLNGLGYPHPKLHSAFFTTKHAGAEGLGWHSDLYYHVDRNAPPTELFLLCYLDDTMPANGCLRVVPGSHRRGRPAHGLGSNPLEGEVSVAMRAGDLFVGHRGLWHATHPNQSDERRTGLTMAIAPDFAGLPESIQALIAGHKSFTGWWPDQADTVDPALQALLPMYHGTAEPIKLLEG